MAADGINTYNHPRVFYTPPPKRNSKPQFSPKNWMSEEKKTVNSPSFHVVHKVPSGDSPYVKAKHVQLIEKDPSKAVALFWNAINSGDRIDSALKDMAVVMKQLDRSNEAIEAIKSFRHLCSADSQESLDNVLLELYKRSGRLEEQIEVLRLKLKRVEEGNTFGGKKVKLARCHGKKVHITVEQEYARLLGNMAWAYLQQNDYRTAEEYYRKALSIEPDKNKQCNLAICLMCTNRIPEAKILLQVIRASCLEGQMDESYGRSYERAYEMLAEIESQPDKSSFAPEKENCCGNVAFTPHKKYSDDQLDQKDRAYYSVDSSAKWTCTPSDQARGIPKSPLTQPKRSPSQLESGRCRKETHRNEPVMHLPRRLQFENLSDMKCNNSESEQHNGVNLSMSSDSTSVKKVMDRKENLPPTEAEQPESVNKNVSIDSCGSPEEWMFPSNKGEKSWADMVEEDEKEMDQFWFLNQHQPKKYSRSNRLQVFQVISPESPRA